MIRWTLTADTRKDLDTNFDKLLGLANSAGISLEIVVEGVRVLITGTEEKARMISAVSKAIARGYFAPDYEHEKSLISSTER